jgi:hypothetical protein
MALYKLDEYYPNYQNEIFDSYANTRQIYLE